MLTHSLTAAVDETAGKPERDFRIARHPDQAPWLFRLLRWLIGGIFARLFVVKVRGGENLPTGNYLLVANHLNWSDSFVLLAKLPAEPRIHFIAKHDEVLFPWWRRWSIGLVGGVIPVNQGSRRSHEEVMSRALGVLRGGGICAIFPEGGTGDREGEMMPFKNGAGRLAVHAGVPVVPIALAGTSDLYLGRRITITIGQPITIPTEPSSIKLRSEAVVREVRAAIEGMLEPYPEPVGVVKRWRWMTNLM